MNNTLIKITEQSFELNNPQLFKDKMLDWAAQYEVACYLDSNQGAGGIGRELDCLLGVAAEAELVFNKSQLPQKDPFEQLHDFYEEEKQWLFGFLTYDLKNSIEQLSSDNFDGLGFPEMHFFKPSFVLQIIGQKVNISSTRVHPTEVFAQIQQRRPKRTDEDAVSQQIPQLKARIEPKEYLATIDQIHKHLHRGDLYELNFCQEFFAENCRVDPLDLFRRLNQLSKAPFSAFYRLNDQYALCASPERFLQKIGRKLISQPIKGTIARGANPSLDQELKQRLLHSQKDRSENVMIVDLVRNDLAKSCVAGSIKVDELFGIYSFEQVHQMISTISGTLRDDVHFTEAIRNAFPMGSMTGAPKVSSMQFIEHFEKSKRGLYSGAVGYISPDGDFDFNVVIRSMMYQASRQYLSFQVGGAIVYDSVAEQEYEECLLKAKGMLAAMGVEVEPLQTD